MCVSSAPHVRRLRRRVCLQQSCSGVDHLHRKRYSRMTHCCESVLCATHCCESVLCAHTVAEYKGPQWFTSLPKLSIVRLFNSCESSECELKSQHLHVYWSYLACFVLHTAHTSVNVTNRWETEMPRDLLLCEMPVCGFGPLPIDVRLFLIVFWKLLAFP